MRRIHAPFIHSMIMVVLIALISGPAVAQREALVGLCHTDEGTGDVVYLEVAESEATAHLEHGDATAPNGPDDCAVTREQPVEESLPTESPPDSREEPAPVAQDDEYTAETGVPLVVPAPGVLENDPGFTSVTLVREPIWGNLDFGRDGSFTYVADRENPGSDGFAYQATNEEGYISFAEVFLHIPNVPPVAVDDILVLNEAGSLGFTSQDLLANDYDADGDSLSLVTWDYQGWPNLVWDPWTSSGVFIPHSTLVKNNHVFTMFVTDGTHQVSSTLTIIVDLSADTDRPSAHPDSYTAAPGGPLTIDAANGLLANDSSPVGSELTASFWQLVPNSLAGEFTVHPDGSFTFMNTTSQWPGTKIEFFYRLTDSQGHAVLGVCTITFG